METELGYDVLGPDSQGELELYKHWREDGNLIEMCVYVTHADLVAILALYDEQEDGE